MNLPTRWFPCGFEASNLSHFLKRDWFESFWLNNIMFTQKVIFLLFLWFRSHRGVNINVENFAGYNLKLQFFERLETIRIFKGAFLILATVVFNKGKWWNLFVSCAIIDFQGLKLNKCHPIPGMFICWYNSQRFLELTSFFLSRIW